MQMRTGILIGLAVILAGVTFFLAKSYLDSQREGYRRQAAAATSQTKIQTAEILVAKVNMPAGTRIKRENVEWRVWPKKGVVKTHFVKGDKKLDDVLGYIVRQGVLAGEPLVKGRIIEQGDRGYMAALLEPGMQAVSIKVRNITSVNGFIKPGDHVDVLLTMKGNILGTSLKARKVTETILKDILVIAVETVTNDQETKPSAAKTITLQVTPKQAQIFTVAERVGSMSFVLRSLAREKYVAVNDDATEADQKPKAGKGGKSGKKGAAGNAKKDGESGKSQAGKSARKADTAEKEADDASDANEEDSVTLRTWDSEVSEVLVQLGGRKDKAEGFEVIRGNQSQRVFIVNEKTRKDVGQAGKNVAKATATGFQAGQRAAGTAASALR